MRHAKASIASTLHGSEDTVTGGHSHETDIKVLAIRGRLTLLQLGIDRLILHEYASDKETNGIGSSIICELLGVSHTKGHAPLDSRRVENRGDYASVCESSDESVLLGVVPIPVVDEASLAGVVVDLT